MNSKGDLVNAAYSRGRISGLTSQPTPDDLALALRRLENMAAEFEGRNIFVGYLFEDDPDANTPHNIPRKYWDAFETNLAVRLLGDFGKDPVPALIAFHNSGFSFLTSDTAPRRQAQYPSRMPRGSGSSLRYNRWQRYYRPQAEAPLSADTIQMFIGDINDFTEHFDAYLRDSETVSSHTITADDGLVVTADTLTSPDIDYTIRADGTSANTSNAFLQVTIVATTSDGRIETRLINFELTER